MKALTVRNNWLANKYDSHHDGRELEISYQLQGKVARSLDALYKRPVHQWSGAVLQSEDLTNCIQKLVNYLSEADKGYKLFGMSIKTLVINDCKITHNEIDLLLNYLSSNTCITNIALSNVHGEYNSNATVLGITNRKSTFSAKNLENLCTMIKTNKNIFSLDLSGNYFGNNGIKELATALEANTIINRLNFSNNDIGDVGVNILAEKISSSVTALGLSHNNITSEGLMYLSRKLENMQVFDLGHNQISDEGIAYLSYTIKQGGAGNLKMLWLDNNKIGDAGAYDLALSTSKVNNEGTNISFLDVSGNVIEAEGLNDLQQMLAYSIRGGFRLKMACQSYNEALQYTKISTNNQNTEDIIENSQIAAKKILSFLKKNAQQDCKVFMLNFDARNDMPEIKSFVSNILGTDKSLIPICTKGQWVGLAIKMDGSNASIAYTDPSSKNWLEFADVSNLISSIISNSTSSMIKNYKHLQEELSSNSEAIIIENLIALSKNIDNLQDLTLPQFQKLVPKAGSVQYVKEKHMLTASENNDFKTKKILDLELSKLYEIDVNDLILHYTNDTSDIDHLKIKVREVIDNNKTVIIAINTNGVFKSSLILNSDGSKNLQIIYHDVSGEPYRNILEIKNLINNLDLSNVSLRIDFSDITPQSYKDINYRDSKQDDLAALNVANLKMILEQIGNFKSSTPFGILSNMDTVFKSNASAISIEKIYKYQQDLIGEYITKDLDSHIFDI